MTGPEHYREAEKWLERAAKYAETDEALTLGYAQVHATLALAAATATARGNADPYDWAAWREVAS